MKTSSFFLRMLLGILVFCAGAACMHVWDRAHLTPADVSVEVSPLSAAFEMDMTQAQMPQGVEDAQDEHTLLPAQHSQMAKVNLPDVQAIIPRSGNTYETEEEEAAQKIATLPVQINGDYPSVNGDTTPQAPTMPTSITMIEAPVETLLIKNAQEYKDFKRRARGSYPTADFNREQVLVLESTSNLPDKVFEIQNVKEENGQWVVEYRVSVFGLDKKTNTHSAIVMKKKDLPITLKQVL